MFELFLVLINNPIDKEIRKLKKENKSKTKLIKQLTLEENETIVQLKRENKNIRLENRNLIKERNRLRTENNNFKNILNEIAVKNKSTVSNSIRNKVLERDNYTCLSCGTKENLTIDHIIPRVEGGTNDIDNLQVLCQHCNLTKGFKKVDYRKDKFEPLIKKQGN
ncbi:MAG: HNH endonuclease [Methanobrevibacter sp.]|nr:HNH endonuclease [Methanobrevibacter sp.]